MRPGMGRNPLVRPFPSRGVPCDHGASIGGDAIAETRIRKPPLPYPSTSGSCEGTRRGSTIAALMANLRQVVAHSQAPRTQLASQLSQLDAAIQALSDLGGSGAARRPRRRLSIAARARIATAQRARGSFES